MKKIFVEPKIKRIELNMKENIASSYVYQMGYYFKTGLFGCFIVETGKKVDKVTEEEAEICKINPNVKIGGGVVILENEVRPYFKR